MQSSALHFLLSIKAPGANGRPIPLETVADVVDARAKTQIYRFDKQRTVKILGDTKPGATMSGVGDEMARIRADAKCCHGPIEAPNQASFVALKIQSGLIASSTTCPGKMIS